MSDDASEWTGPPAEGDELPMLLGVLERNRRTFAWKCGGVDADGLLATVGDSAITLGGLIKHLALVEEYTLSNKLHGRELGPPWEANDWDVNQDWEWTSAADDSPGELMAQWERSVAIARAAVDEALAAGGLDFAGGPAWPDGRIPTLRRLLLDMVEEYARHTGHADLIRETVDGLVGEDSPR